MFRQGPNMTTMFFHVSQILVTFVVKIQVNCISRSELLLEAVAVEKTSAEVPATVRKKDHWSVSRLFGWTYQVKCVSISWVIPIVCPLMDATAYRSRDKTAGEDQKPTVFGTWEKIRGYLSQTFFHVLVLRTVALSIHKLFFTGPRSWLWL